MFRVKIAACVVLAASVSGCTYVVKDTAVVCDTVGHAPVQATLPPTAGQSARRIVLVLDYWLIEVAPGQADNGVWLALSASNEGRRTVVIHRADRDIRVHLGESGDAAGLLVVETRPVQVAGGGRPLDALKRELGRG